MLLNSISNLFKGRLIPILAILIVTLIVSVSVMTKLYLNEVSITSKLQLQLKSKSDALESLNKQLSEERLANSKVVEAEKVVEVVYKEIVKNVVQIPTEECIAAPNTDGVAELLCSNGLATGTACANASSSIFTQGD